ncbi:MAG: hypothetical protein EZS28_021800, partial [Streblomastix strix]
MAAYTENVEEKKDYFYLETLAIPSEINSMVVGRFFNKNVESLILAKSTFLSIFNNNEDEDSFDFIDHISVYKEVYSLCTSVQPNSLDCLFVLSIGGEWLLLQWNKNKFFPLASGSILKAIQPLMKTPEQRRFRLDPSFQWAVSVVPITDNSPRFFTRPAQKQDSKHSTGSTKPIVRISFRAVIVVDETVFVGVKYDGPDSNFLSVIKDNWSSALKQFPGEFGFFDLDNKQGYKEENMNAMIRNGLENEWKVLQTIEENKKNLFIADADTFIFLEDDDDQPKNIQQKEKNKHSQNKNTISLFRSINRVRHLTFTTSMRLEPFPIKKKPFIMSSFPYPDPLGRERDGEVAGPGLSEIQKRGRIQLPEYCPSTQHYLKAKHNQQQGDNSNSLNIKSESANNNQSCTTAIAIVDQPVGTSAISLLFDFEHHRIQLHSFIITALPPSTSRVMTIIDEERVMKTLKGVDISLLNRVHCGDVNVVKAQQDNLVSNEPIPNFHPFLTIASASICLFTSHMTLLKLKYPTPFTEPPMSVLFAGGQEKDYKHHLSQFNKQSSRKDLNLMRKDIKSVDKLFIAAGRSLIVLCNGQFQRHTYPYKWFNELVMTNGANCSDTEQQSLNSQSSDQPSVSKSEIDDIQLRLGTSMLFIISASNSSMIVDMSTGTFYEFPGQESEYKELGEGGPEDFQLNVMNINSVNPIPKYSFSPFHTLNERIILGVGNGRTGAIHSLAVGNKLQTIMQGRWYSQIPQLFTSKAYSGDTIHSLLLVEEEKVDAKDTDEKKVIKKDIKDKIQKKSTQKKTIYPGQFLIGEDIQRTYSSQLYQIHEDDVEPID